MKTIKNGLVALAFAASGCGAVRTLSDLEARNLPSEEITINGSDICKKESVFMDSDGYRIRCEVSGTFREFEYNVSVGYGGEETSFLDWDSVSYMDAGNNGTIDAVIVLGEQIQVSGLSRANYRYHQILSNIKQPRIHRIWKQRWGHSE